MTRFFLLLGASLVFVPDAHAWAGPALPSANRKVDFARDVQPIFAKHCVGCHGPEKQRGGLRLDDGTAAQKGGNTGAALKPKDPAGSLLLRAVSGLDPERQMPPRERPRLTQEEIVLLRTWIEQGA